MAEKGINNMAEVSHEEFMNTFRELDATEAASLIGTLAYMADHAPIINQDATEGEEQ